MRKALAAADLLRITVGEEWGGMGLGDVEASIVLEEMAGPTCPRPSAAELTFNGPPRGIEHLGPPSMKERWLPAAADGEALISIGITEPDAGSAVQNMRAALVEDGPGRWRLNAYKNYSTLGDVAQGVLVWCRWPGGEGVQGHRRRHRADRPGGRVRHRAPQGDGDPRRHGGRARLRQAWRSPPATSFSAGTPSDTSAFKVLLSHLNHERCGNASMCVGAAQGALEHAVRYMNDRVIGGRPLGELQGLQWKLADVAVQLEGARMLLARAVRLAGPHGTPRLWRPRWPRLPGLRRQVRVRRGHADPRWLRLLAWSTRWSGPTETSGACALGLEPWRRSATTSVCGWPPGGAPVCARLEGSACLPGEGSARPSGETRYGGSLLPRVDVCQRDR